MSILTQTKQTVNADTRFWGGRTDNSFANKAYTFGVEDGKAGIENRAWEYFLDGGVAAQAYNYGYMIGVAQRAPWKVAFDNGASADGGCSLPSDRNPERTKIIRDQVRFAKTRGERQDALNAAMAYSPGVFDMLMHMYPVYELAEVQ